MTISGLVRDPIRNLPIQDVITDVVTELDVQSLTVSPATTTKAAAETQQLAVTAKMSSGASVVVTAQATYGTSDATKATVNAAGLITAVATGTATITATYGGKSATCVVTVS